MNAVYTHNALIATAPLVDGRKVLSYCKAQHDLPGIGSSVSSIAAGATAAAVTVAKWTRMHWPNIVTFANLQSTLGIFLTWLTTVPHCMQHHLPYILNIDSSTTLRYHKLDLSRCQQADCMNVAAAAAHSGTQQVQAAKAVKKQI
jgi:hypothetical protein